MRFSSIAGLFAAALAVCTGQAQILISDTFTGANGTLISAHTPDTNLPGGSYIVNGTGWGSGTIQNNTLSQNTDMGVGISLASSGSYTKPTNLTISADLNIGTLTGDVVHANGVGLGFYVMPNNAAFHGGSGFLGLILSPTGNLSFTSIDTSGSYIKTVIQTFTYSGTWDAAVNHSLSYSVNTTTGNFSNILLDSITYGFSSTALFTDTATTYAGLSVSSSTGSKYGYADNFQINPEPSTFSLLVLGGLALVPFLRRRAHL